MDSEGKFFQPIYVLSKRGKRLLSHNGFHFTVNGNPLQVTENEIRTRWKCTFAKNHRYVCKAKIHTHTNTDGTERAEFYGNHCHG